MGAKEFPLHNTQITRLPNLKSLQLNAKLGAKGEILIYAKLVPIRFDTSMHRNVADIFDCTFLKGKSWFNIRKSVFQRVQLRDELA